MKRIMILCSLAAFVTSCTKEKPLAQVGKVTLTAVSQPVSIATPGGYMFMGKNTVTISNLTDPEIATDFTMVGNVPVQKFYFVLKNGNDSIVSPVYQNVSQISGDFIKRASGTYTMYMYALVTAGSIGEIQVKSVIEWQGNDVSTGEYQHGWTSETITSKTVVSPYDAMPLIKVNDLNQQIEDSAFVDYEFTVTNPSSSFSMTIPQFTFSVNINDVGNNDTISAYKLQWLINGQDSTERVAFTRNGTQTLSLPEGITKVYTPYVTGARQQVIAPSGMVKINFRLYFTGLRNPGNNVSIQLLANDSKLSQVWYYVNQALPGINLKLTDAQTSGSSGTAVNFVWGLIQGSQSAVPGNSSKSFTNGYGIPSGTVIYYSQK